MKKFSLITASVAGTAVMAVAGFGVASAATTSNGNVGTSGIPRATFRQERQDAVAQVLGTTTANVQAAHKAKTMDDLISKAGLTKQTFAQKVKAQLTTDLTAKGYSQDQITIALQHREIVRLHHKAKND